jgi:hypothetical protein
MLWLNVREHGALAILSGVGSIGKAQQKLEVLKLWQDEEVEGFQESVDTEAG